MKLPCLGIAGLDFLFGVVRISQPLASVLLSLRLQEFTADVFYELYNAKMDTNNASPIDVGSLIINYTLQHNPQQAGPFPGLRDGPESPIRGYELGVFGSGLVTVDMTLVGRDISVGWLPEIEAMAHINGELLNVPLRLSVPMVNACTAGFTNSLAS